MVLIVVSEANPLAAVKALLIRSSYVLVPVSVVIVKYFPDFGRYYDYWTGRVYYRAICTDKNMLGMTLTVLALALMWALLDAGKRKSSRDKKLEILVYALLLAMNVWLLRLADCATALACIVVGVVTMLLLGLRNVRRNIRVWMILGIFSAAVLALPDVRSTITEPIVRLLGRDVTFTGRDAVWRAVLEQDVNPIVGVGSYSFWMGERVEKPLPGLGGWANEAHNAYLEIYLNVEGLIGLGLYLSILATGVRKSVRELVRGKNGVGESFRLAFVIVAVMYGATEAVVRSNLIWLGLLMVVVRVSRPGTRSFRKQETRSSNLNPLNGEVCQMT